MKKNERYKITKLCDETGEQITITPSTSLLIANITLKHLNNILPNNKYILERANQ